MILAIAIGWALQRFAGLRDGVLLLAIAGLVVAQLIPAGGRGCAREP